jgi:hypothetical protein
MHSDELVEEWLANELHKLWFVCNLDLRDIADTKTQHATLAKRYRRLLLLATGSTANQSAIQTIHRRETEAIGVVSLV